MKLSAPATLLIGGALVVASPGVAVADTAYVGLAVGYQISGIPQGVSYVGDSAADAKKGALAQCSQRLSACAPAGTSTQCLAVATGAGTRWMEAEGPDRSAAEANARTRLIEFAQGLPLAMTLEVTPAATGACAWD